MPTYPSPASVPKVAPYAIEEYKSPPKDTSDVNSVNSYVSEIVRNRSKKKIFGINESTLNLINLTENSNKASGFSSSRINPILAPTTTLGKEINIEKHSPRSKMYTQ